VVPVEGLGFYTVDVMHPIWTEDVHTDKGFAEFVRIHPPPTATDEQVEFVRRHFRDAGALDVQVLARPKAQVVTDQATVKYETKGIRATVEAMVIEANTHDRDALSAVVQETLSAVKL
jgi:hypothetical protein